MRSNFLPVIFFSLLLISQGNSGPRKNSSIMYQEAAKTALSGDLDKAIAVFKEVIDISPSFSLGYYGLGKAYLYKQGMLDDALIYLKMAVKFDKSLSRGYFYLGMAYMLKKKYGEALNAFQTAYDQDKTMLEALFNIGAIYDMLQNNHMAAQYFEDYLSQKQKREENIIF
jgi:tetratricopeptide (TPR) repeat protein